MARENRFARCAPPTEQIPPVGRNDKGERVCRRVAVKACGLGRTRDRFSFVRL